MGKNSNGSAIFTRERREKWFGRSRTHYGRASTILTVASGICGAGAAGLPLFCPDFVGAVSAVLAPFLAAGSWALRNADKDKLDARSKTDFDGLVRAIDKSHSRLSYAASVPPDDKLAKIYIETVLDELRRLLEPEGKDNCVRLCLYRKDSGERKEKADGDPNVEREFNSDTEEEATVSFKNYVFQRGGRSDLPRLSFNSTEPPGSEFFDELFRIGRYYCNSPEEFVALGEDNYYKGKVNRPAYKSFVNIALRDEDNETFAMLTCDSTEENFFDERRHRLIKAFIPLLKLALQDGATHVPEPKFKRDQVESSIRRKPIRPSKPKRRIVQAEKQGDDHDA